MDNALCNQAIVEKADIEKGQSKKQNEDQTVSFILHGFNYYKEIPTKNMLYACTKIPNVY